MIIKEFSLHISTLLVLSSGLLSLTPAEAQSIRRYHATTINVPGAGSTVIHDINDGGVMAGDWYSPDYSINQGFVRWPDGALTNVPPADTYSGIGIFGLNECGDVVGFMETDGFLRRGTNFTILSPPGSGSTFARAVNDAGIVVGDAYGASGAFNWRYDGTNYSSFAIPGATQTGFTDINDSGDILGYSARELVTSGQTNTVTDNWLLSGTNRTVLSFPGSTLNWHISLANNGTILGGFRMAATGRTNRYYLWRAGDFTEISILREAGARYFPGAVNSAGEIVGYYLDTNDVYHGFRALPLIETDHIDVGLAFDDGQWNLHLHDEENDLEYASDGAILYAGASARAVIPPDPQYGFLGSPGAPTWILPQAQDPALPFLGVAAHEISNGLFASNQVRLVLDSVSGPGHLAIYSVLGFGTPVVHINSRDGISASDGLTVITGSHAHYNWAFSAPGTYTVRLVARAVFASNLVETVSPPAEYVFEIAPGQPAAPVLLEPGKLGSDLVFKLAAERGLPCVIETSTTLTNWVPVLTNIPSAFPETITLPGAATDSIRFFRSVNP